MSGEDPFKPFPLFLSRHAQTIGATIFSFYRVPDSQRRFVYLNDGERISLEIAIPPDWKDHQLTVVMVHGLCGSHQSRYLVRMASKLYQKNIRSIRVNLKGCGSGRGYAKKIYHPDCSHDLWAALEEIRRETPNSPIIVVGFSFGGNVALKMAGEHEEEARQLIEKVIAINPPIDLRASAYLLSQNKLYERYFMRYFRAEVDFLHRHFNLEPIDIPRQMGILGFDEFYLAPHSGYQSAKEYYYAMSSGRLLPAVRVPCRILFSRDDPIVDSTVLDSVCIPDHIQILSTQKGGHLGFLGMPGRKGAFYWMDSVILDWIFEQVDKPANKGPDSSSASR